MSTDNPDIVDAWRMAANRRHFEGRIPLSAMPRLGELLLDSDGEATYSLDFDRDAMQVPYVELHIKAQLPLLCQRSLQRFLYPVELSQRLGLIADEEGEAALPTGYEPLLLDSNGELAPADLVEDELILAIPVVPVMPGSEAVQYDQPATTEELKQANPFSALTALKKH